MGILPATILGVVLNALFLICMFWNLSSVKKDEEVSVAEYVNGDSVHFSLSSYGAFERFPNLAHNSARLLHPGEPRPARWHKSIHAPLKLHVKTDCRGIVDALQIKDLSSENDLVRYLFHWWLAPYDLHRIANKIKNSCLKPSRRKRLSTLTTDVSEKEIVTVVTPHENYWDEHLEIQLPNLYGFEKKKTESDISETEIVTASYSIRDPAGVLVITARNYSYSIDAPLKLHVKTDCRGIVDALQIKILSSENDLVRWLAPYDLHLIANKIKNSCLKPSRTKSSILLLRESELKLGLVTLQLEFLGVWNGMKWSHEYLKSIHAPLKLHVKTDCRGIVDALQIKDLNSENDLVSGGVGDFSSKLLLRESELKLGLVTLQLEFLGVWNGMKWSHEYLKSIHAPLKLHVMTYCRGFINALQIKDLSSENDLVRWLAPYDLHLIANKIKNSCLKPSRTKRLSTLTTDVSGKEIVTAGYSTRE
ncbi:putative transporter arsB isoform 1 protein [Corchorus capsularis]|uniref:Putative transporter arsB isoform 1 protein n=1 Tax=Corchorus capsularis TaxID=210143 RepID=A0A1R3IGL9_COCAP|nr:putative transporter arsB isoform 1 protein [Corchorus capsularis]